MKLTKANKTNAIPAILEIAGRSTKPFSAVKMAQKLNRHQANFNFDSESVFSWLKQLVEQGQMERIGVIVEHGEKYIGFQLSPHGHVWHVCDCGKTGCQFCDGGLGFCTVCKGFEGTLTTHCCGRPLTKKEEYKIYSLGQLDYRDGEWVNEPNFRRSPEKN